MHALHAAEIRNRAILQAIPDMKALIDWHGTVLDFKPGHGRASRRAMRPEATIGRRLDEVLPEDVARRVLLTVRSVLASGELQTVVYHLPGASGETHFEARCVACASNEVLVLVRDVTEQRRNENKIRQLAYFDGLTGIPNRQQFMEGLTRALSRAQKNGQKLALLFLDLDRFKTVNDTLGHEAGDQLLQGVAQRLRDCLRIGDSASHVPADTHDANAGTTGGRRIHTDPRELSDIRRLHAGKRIWRARRPFAIVDQDISVTCSIGIAMFPDDGQDAVTLLKHGDAAMYRAKDGGAIAGMSTRRP